VPVQCVSSTNPKQRPGDGATEQPRDRGPKTLVCGLAFDSSTESGTQLVKRALQSAYFKVELTDSLHDLTRCDRVIVVVTEGIFADKNMQTILGTAIENETPVYALVETKQHGGMTISDWINNMPTEYSALKEQEAVPLFRDPEYMVASIQTVLNQHADKVTAENKIKSLDTFDFFLSHHQKDAQGNCTTLYYILEEVGFKVWLDMKARDLPTKGMMRGVADSATFLLFLTKDLFTRPYCLSEIREAVRLNKRIVVIYEERPDFGGLKLEQHLENLPEEFRILRDDQEKHGWLAFKNRHAFCDTMCRSCCSCVSYVHPRRR
jgi:hypothetical protein